MIVFRDIAVPVSSAAVHKFKRTYTVYTLLIHTQGDIQRLVALIYMRNASIYSVMDGLHVIYLCGSALGRFQVAWDRVIYV